MWWTSESITAVGTVRDLPNHRLLGHPNKRYPNVLHPVVYMRCCHTMKKSVRQRGYCSVGTVKTANTAASSRPIIVGFMDALLKGGGCAKRSSGRGTQQRVNRQRKQRLVRVSERHRNQRFDVQAQVFPHSIGTTGGEA